jgi:hypothetical protein
MNDITKVSIERAKEVTKEGWEQTKIAGRSFFFFKRAIL